ncbi:MAG: hypothetical protein COA79_10705 [Planctomycetota bacterium]|nr:MAG: hypothetical protein COA79_10705 [Planctomycetota bacterium]
MLKTSGFLLFCLIAIVIIIFSFSYHIFKKEWASSNIIGYSSHYTFKHKNNIINDSKHESNQEKEFIDKQIQASQLNIPNSPKIINKAELLLSNVSNGQKLVQNNIVKEKEVDRNFSTRNTDYSLNDQWVATYGDSVKRSTSRAIFQLKDSKGYFLESGILKEVRLHRKIKDDLWIEDQASYNHKTGNLICDGLKYLGLEPGEYLLEIDGGGYGFLEITFEIIKNEVFRDTYFMPNYRRIINVHFSDMEGNPINYIKNVPFYKLEKSKAPFGVFKSKKRIFLHEPPSNIRFGNCMGGSRRSYGCGGVKVFAYKTDKGRYLIRVFSGKEAKIIFHHYSSKNTSDSYQYSGLFDEKKDSDIYIITNPLKVEKREGHYYSIVLDKKVYIISESSPGNNYLNKEIILKPVANIEWKQDEIRYGQTGLRIELQSTTLDLKLHLKTKKYYSFDIRGSQNVFLKNIRNYALKENHLERYQWTDKRLYYSKWRKIDITKNSIASKSDYLNLKNITLKFNSTPTMQAFAQNNTTLKLADKNEVLLNDEGEISTYVDYKTDLLSLSLRIQGFYKVGRNRWSNSSSEKKYLLSNYKNDISVKQNISFQFLKTNQISSKILEVPAINNTVILRMLINYDAGLPWVEASLICHDEIDNALAVRKALMTAPNKKELNELDGLDYFELTDPENNEIIDETKKVINSAIKNKDVLKYLIKNGSWYNTHVKGLSDARGYLVITSPILKLGKKYTLFLWSNSKDHNMPDKVISFQANEYITDLGSIQF